MNRLGFQVACLLLAGNVSAACGVASPGATPPEVRVRELVAREAQVQLAAWRTPLTEISPSSIILTPVPTEVSGIRVWEARAPVDHWHRYVVAVNSDRIWRLAGFSMNDLTEFYNVTRGETSPRNLFDTVRFLVSLTEPNGDKIVYALGDAPVWDTWVSRRPLNWPTDTTHITPERSRLVRQTILSQQVNSYDRGWVPTVYTFLFDDDGELRAWGRREGQILRP